MAEHRPIEIKSFLYDDSFCVRNSSTVETDPSVTNKTEGWTKKKEKV